jgi:hypothetical protein
MDVVRTGLWKGCLGGLGLVIVFFIISGLTYLLLSQAGLSNGMTIVLSIASGPIIGTLGVLLPLYLRARRALQSDSTIDETTQRDAP